MTTVTAFLSPCSNRLSLKFIVLIIFFKHVLSIRLISYQDWGLLTRDWELLLSLEGMLITLGEKALSR